MTLLLNLLWMIFGGFIMAVLWALAGVIAAISIVGLPWARACFTIASFTLLPFGREAIDRRLVTGREDIGTGPLGLIGNILWFVTLGVWLALGHLVSAVFWGCTIIGIPFALQHIKLVGISMAPIGMAIVDSRDLRYRP
jgi:uncharacterized membrane protein YccF (DUF307 family)